jgi:hypothetical protein
MIIQSTIPNKKHIPADAFLFGHIFQDRVSGLVNSFIVWSMLDVSQHADDQLTDNHIYDQCEQ